MRVEIGDEVENGILRLKVDVRDGISMMPALKDGFNGLIIKEADNEVLSC